MHRFVLLFQKIEFKELEEWCVSEVSGMSATRITRILNGHPMLESSNTDESDDSGKTWTYSYMNAM